MKITLENGKQIEISDESFKQLSESVIEINDNSELKDGYGSVCDLDKKSIKTTIPKNKQIYVNQIFDDKSVFGDSCIFIKCKFGSSCDFGSSCEFGSYCEFGSGCEFGLCCEFGSGCEFYSYCDFDSGCEFGSYCKKIRPYWDENGKHN